MLNECQILKHRAHSKTIVLASVLVIFLSGPLWGTTDAPRTYGGRTLGEWSEIIQAGSSTSLATPHTIESLTQIISDDQAPWQSRRLAALTLGRMGAPAQESVSVLQQILTKTDELATKLWCLKALALFELEAEQATPQVAEIVLDEQALHVVRVNALETLGRIGRQRRESIVTFIEVLRRTTGPDHDRELRMVAADGLWLLGPAASPALPELIRAAQDEWALTRLAAATSIGQIGPLAEIAIPTLVDIILFDPAGEVRESAADALANIGSAALPALQQLLQDHSPAVRSDALRGLGKFPAEHVVTSIRPLLQDPVPLIRTIAATVLLDKQPSDAAAIRVLLNELTAEHRGARIAAYRELSKLNGQLHPYRTELAAIRDNTKVPAQTRTAAARLLDAATVKE